MNLPIVIFEQSCDLLVFDTKELAESYLEPVDVKNGEYSGFDCQGMLLMIAVEKNKVKISDTENTDEKQFRERLVDFLSRVKKTERSELLKWPLMELIEFGR